jgi:hypothetical protein
LYWTSESYKLDCSLFSTVNIQGRIQKSLYFVSTKKALYRLLFSNDKLQ